MAAKFSPPSKLLTAIRTGKLTDVVDALDNGADLEEADIHGCVGLPLRTACFEGSVDIVRELLNRGADLNAIAADGPGAPMRLAQRGKHQAVIELLIERGAANPYETKVLAEPAALFPPAQDTVPETPLEPEAEEPAPENMTLATTATKDASIIDAEPEPAVIDNLIEYTPTAIPDHAIEELDLTACYGVDTNLLDFDLQRLIDTQDAHKQEQASAEAVKPKSRFWNSSTEK
jgi:ankyrin repeat protein